MAPESQTEFFADRFRSADELLEDFYNLYVYVNGQFVRWQDASLSVWDHGLLYSDGVFEGIRAYGAKVFKLPEHIARLFQSAQGMQITGIPLTEEEIAAVVVRTLQINGLRDAHIKVIITRGIGPMGMDPRRTPCPTIIVLTYPFPPLLGRQSVRLISSSVRRKSPHSVDAKIKTIAYIDNLFAKLQAIACGVDDAVMLDMAGVVAETTSANVFVVRDGSLFTPKTTAALHGITRGLVMEMARELELEVAERDLTMQDLYAADEVFLTGTAVEIAAVGEVDGRRIKLAPGPVTVALKEKYSGLVAASGTAYANE